MKDRHWMLIIETVILGYFSIFWAISLSNLNLSIDLSMDNNTAEAIKSINYSAIESASNPQNRCFERTIRWDRNFDIKNNEIISSSFYNTSWVETDCRKFNQDMIYNPSYVEMNNNLTSEAET